MSNLDVDGDGTLSYDELVMTCVQRKLSEKEERLWNAFCKVDLNHVKKNRKKIIIYMEKIFIFYLFFYFFFFCFLFYLFICFLYLFFF
jgi:hypothetical protein